MTGIALLVGFVLAIAAIAVVMYQFAPTPTDEANCPTDGPAKFVVVLVDVTDTLSAVQTQALRNGFQLIRDEIVPVHGSLELFAVEEDGSKLLTHRVALCKPERSGSALIRNQRRLEETWHKRYQEPFDQALEVAASASASARSPILEAMRSVAVTSLQAPTRAQKKRVLIVFSDFLQNTPQVSFYKSVPDGAAFLASSEFRQLRFDLAGVFVILVQIERPSAPDDKQLMQLWKQIIQAEGAAGVCVASLQSFRMDAAMECAASEGERQ